MSQGLVRLRQLIDPSFRFQHVFQLVLKNNKNSGCFAAHYYRRNRALITFFRFCRIGRQYRLAVRLFAGGGSSCLPLWYRYEKTIYTIKAKPVLHASNHSVIVLPESLLCALSIAGLDIFACTCSPRCTVLGEWVLTVAEWLDGGPAFAASFFQCGLLGALAPPPAESSATRTFLRFLPALDDGIAF